MQAHCGIKVHETDLCFFHFLAFSLYHYYFQWLLQGSSVHWMSNTDSWLDDKRSSLATKHTDRLRRLTICRFVLVNYMLNHLSSKHKFVWCVSYLFAAAWSHVQKRDDSFIKIRSNTTVQQVEPPAEFFFQLRLAEQYFRLIFGSAGFTRTGENVAELRLVAQFEAKIRIKQ